MTFPKIASKASAWLGSARAFILAVLLVVGWGVTGPLFDYSDGWSLFINTVTTVITFIAVFLIQNTQNRDMVAIHLKLDELIRVSEARNVLINIEESAVEDVEAARAILRSAIRRED